MKDQLKNRCGKLKRASSAILILVALSACSSNPAVPSADVDTVEDRAVAQAAAVQQSTQLTLEARKAQLEEIKARKLEQRKRELEKIKAVRQAQFAQQNRQRNQMSG